MSIFKFFARKFVPGTTARIVGKNYIEHLKIFEDDKISDKEIFEKIILSRFQTNILNNEQKKHILIENIDKIQNLKDLVIGIFIVEQEFLKNTFKNQLVLEEIVLEELTKLKIPIDKIGKKGYGREYAFYMQYGF